MINMNIRLMLIGEFASVYMSVVRALQNAVQLNPT